MTNFNGDELVAPRPTTELKDNPLSVVRSYIFNVFAVTFHIWKPFLHPQTEDAPCRGVDRDPHITDCIFKYNIHEIHAI
jgi:hypothetical protein